MIFKPVVFGGYVNGYSLARTFKETYNIKSIICDYTNSISYYSEFCEYRIVTDPQKNEELFVEEVQNIGKLIREDKKIPLLIVTNDIWLIPLSKYKEELEKIFMYTFSDVETINELANKNKLYELCDKIGVDYPKTYKYNNYNESIENLTPPLLIKPSNVPEFIGYFPNKKRNGVFSTLEDARAYLEEIYSKGYKDEMIIQEYIPGGVENLYTCTTYSTQKGIVKGVSVGCKLSQYPEEAGTITSGLIKYDEEVESLTKKIIEYKKFFGIANTEFKYDARDNSYKLIEVNARPGMWNYSSILSGVNLIEKMIDDIVFNKEITFTRGMKSLIWTRISKGEIFKFIEGTENADDVKELFRKKEVYDPLVNIEEGIGFKSQVILLNVKSRLIKLYRKWIKK